MCEGALPCSLFLLLKRTLMRRCLPVYRDFFALTTSLYDAKKFFDSATIGFVSSSRTSFSIHGVVVFRVR